MATPVVSAPTAAIRRLTVDEVLAMVAAEILTEYDRVELEDGVLVELSPQDPRHETAKERLNAYFSKAGYRVRVEGMLIKADDAYVLPDLMIAESFVSTEHPRTAPLTIEVANTSLRRDQAKAATYAAAGVDEYWIVDLNGGRLIVHRDPSGERYTEVTEHRSGTVQPLLPTPPLPLSELFAD